MTNNENGQGCSSSLATLRKQFDTIIAQKKAAELGVETSEVVKTVAGGKTVWKTKKEVSVLLEKRAKLRPQPKIQRALRGGDDSIVGDITKRLEQVDRCLQDLNGLGVVEMMENRDIQTSLNNIVQRVTGQMEHLAEIENRIESKKSGDPFVQKMDEVARRLARAQAEGDQETVRQLAETHAADLQKYQTWRRSIQPDVEAALFCRVALLQEQRRVYKYVGDFLLKAINARITGALNHPDHHSDKNKTVAAWVKTSSSLSARWDELNVHLLSVGALKSKSIEEQSTLLGEEIERLRDLVGECETLNQTVLAHHANTHPVANAGPKSRMAFPTRDS